MLLMLLIINYPCQLSAPCYSQQLNKESSPWDWGQSGIKFGKKSLYTKSLQLFRRKRISMLTGLKMPPLTRKGVFYKPEHNAKGNPMELNFSGL